MNAINGIIKFQADRDLHKREFDWSVEATNILEELLEAIGINDRNVALLSVGDMQIRIREKTQAGLVIAPSKVEQVDAFADVCVFAIGAIMKLGYDPEKVLAEVGKEINSRIGSMKDGKFVKDKSVEAKANWYKADFSDAKLSIIVVTEAQRKAFFAGEGYMGSDIEVKAWMNKLLG